MKKLFPLMLMLCCALCAKATVKINGVTLTSGTKLTKLSTGYGITAGTISLSGTTLTLSNVTMSTSKTCVESDAGLTIKLVGTNTLTCTSAYGNNVALQLANTSSAQSFTITSDYGRGKLTATCTNSYALVNDKSTITFSYCDVTLNGNSYSIWSTEGTATEIINVTNAHLTLNKNNVDNYTLSYLKGLNLTGCSLAKGYVFSNGGVRKSSTDNNFVQGTIEFVPDSYPIYVKGTQITSLIMKDVLNDGGSVKYSPTYNNNEGLLQLLGTDINYDGTCIQFNSNSANKANLWIKGANKITSSKSLYSGIISYVPLTIWSNESDTDASLTVTNKTTSGRGIYSMGNLIIRNLKLDVTAFCCICDMNKKANNLTFDNANVTAKSSSTSGQVIYGFGNVTYNKCNITTPTSATYNTTNKYYTSQGSTFDNLVITKGSDSVAPTVYSVRTTSKSYNTATIAWNMEDNHTSKSKLKMFYSLVKGSYLVENGNLSDGATSVSLSGLEAGTTYTLRVRAQDEAGLYGYSEDYKFTTTAITNYNLKIAGTAVSSINCKDILGDGTVKYDPTDNVLTLRNANLTADNSTQYAIEANITGLTIKVEGTNTVTATRYCLYHNASNITIKGDSRNDKLYLNSEAYSSLGDNLTIKDCTVEASNIMCGRTGNLVVDNANVKAYTIMQYDNVEMKNGVKVLWPTGATYRKASNGIMRHGIGDKDVYNVFLGIEADDVDYGISVAGTAVKYSNYNDILGDGSVSYDNATSTLTIKNSIHIPAGSKAITKTSGDLNIVVHGACCITSESWEDAIETSGDVYIRGDNSNLEKSFIYFFHEEGGIGYTEGQHITFSKYLSVRNCILMVGGPINGSSSSSMNIDNAVVKATNIKGFGQILMENEYVSSSPVSNYDSTKKAFCYANGDEAEGVVISPAPLYVNNIAVTPENANKILEGISYNFDTNTLTFSGSTSYPWSIRSAGSLIIQVDGGFNMIQQSDESNTNMGINCGGDLTIRGFGSLMVTGYGKGIVCDGNLYVKDVNLMVYSTDIAIRALNNVTLNGASVEMSATAENGMCIYCKDIYLQSCKVEKPTDITISDESSWTKLKSIKYAKINADRTFSLFIAGTAVTDQNKNDVLGDGGTVTYDPTNGTLYLKNATINGGNTAHAIQDYQDDLKIELSGENTLFSNYGAPIATTGSVSISGEITKDYSSNILRISHTEAWTSSIGCKGKASIFNCSVYADKISSSQGTDTIKITEAYVESGIANFAYVNLDRTYIETDCHYDTANKKFVDGNNAEVSTVVIRPIILRVGGIDVTKNNCSDIFGDQTASYDFDTKVLTLHNANITNGNINSICQLEIKLEGENTLAFDDSTTSGIETARGKLTINGPGSLTVTNTVILIAKWVQDKEPVTIQNCTLNSTACNNGIINSNSPIVINNSNVNFPRCNPFIGSSLTLENCHSVNQTEADLVESLKEWDWTDDPVKIVADIILGDVNNDGKVNIADIPDLITLLTPKRGGILIYKLRYDANSDGKINVKDIKAIENRILGK